MSEKSANPSLNFVLLMASMMATTAISIDAMLPALGEIGKALNASHANQSQLIVSVLFFGLAIGQLIAGPLSDAIGRKPLLFLCLVVYVAGAIICLLAPNMNTMLAGRAIQGLGAAGPVVTAISVIRDKFEGPAMAKVMSFIMMIFIMAPVLAPAIGQFILLFVSWRAIFVFFIIYAAVIFICVNLFLEETLTPENRRPFQIKSILKGFKIVVTHRPTLLYSLAMGCVFAGFIGYLTSTQQIYREQFGIGEMFVVWFGLQALGFGFSSLLNSKFVEKLGVSYIVSRALVLLIAIGAIMAIWSSVAGVPFAAFFIFGIIALFTVGLLFGNLNTLAMEAMGALAGTATAIISFIANLVSLSIGTLIGQLYDGTLLPLSIGFLVMGTLAFILLKLADRARQKHA